MATVKENRSICFKCFLLSRFGQSTKKKIIAPLAYLLAFVRASVIIILFLL